jgi:hypothetical protein
MSIARYSRARLFLVVLAAVAAIVLDGGCRRRAAEVAEYNDPHPLPEDPMVVDAPSLGQHGGRFVFAETGNPRTFNGMMANETSSADITVRSLFTFLVDYDNGSQKYVPGEKTVLGRNPYWFGVDKAGKRLPYLDEVVFLVVPDQDAADLKFRAGELDALDNIKPENYRYYEENQAKGNYTLHSLGPEMSSRFFWFVRQQKPATPQEAKIDELVDRMVTTLDLDGRKAIWKEIQTIWNEQAWAIWLPILNVKVPMSNRFGNAQPSIMAHRLIWNIDRVYVKSRDS